MDYLNSILDSNFFRKIINLPYNNNIQIKNGEQKKKLYKLQANM